MLDKQAIQLELDEKAMAHKRKMDIEDARVRTATMCMEQSARLALEAAKKDMEAGMDPHEAFAKNDPSPIYATSYLYKEALDGQYARERVGLYAALDVADDQASESVSTDEPSDTWMHQFMKLASDLRDEEAYELWGKALAGEIRKPGSFSLRFLNILATLDKRDAESFQKLAPFVLVDFVPDKIWRNAGINVYSIKTLESLGLLMTGTVKIFTGFITVMNEHYMSFPALLDDGKKYSIPSAILTPAGEELLKLAAVSKEDAMKAISAFVELVKNDYGLELHISERSQST